MVTYLSEFITLFLLKKEIIDQKEYVRIRYGFEIILSSIINILIVLVPALIFNKKVISAIFLLVFILIRKYSGGYHADTYLKCNILFGIIYCCSIILTEICKYNIIRYYLYFIVLMLLSSGIIIYMSPIENKNKKINENDKLKYKMTVLFLVTISDIIAIICSNIYPSIMLIISITLFEIMLLCLFGKIKERRKKNEKL